MIDNSSTKELTALISLIDDPDHNVFQEIEKRIFSFGKNAIPELEKAWEKMDDSIMQKRIENLIHSMQKSILQEDFKKWLDSEEKDLLTGFILASRISYPELNSSKIMKEIGKIIQDIWLELNNNLSPLEKTKVLNHVIYDIQKFRANKSNVLAIDNFHINRILETRLGNAMSLGLLYLIIAQSLKIPIYGVDLSRHFILAYSDEKKVDVKIEDYSKEDILFYLNPFYKGVVFSEKEIDVFVKQLGLETKEEFFLPTNSRNIIQRLLLELRTSLEKHKEQEKLSALNEILILFDKI